mmetsp:Transcript_22900/g.71823  ORF Transcript_22900/g.71823 Transcript_22900/m.71823 type:complete len:307 (-) Transcript_22900:465-1385(-)
MSRSSQMARGVENATVQRLTHGTLLPRPPPRGRRLTAERRRLFAVVARASPRPRRAQALPGRLLLASLPVRHQLGARRRHTVPHRPRRQRRHERLAPAARLSPRRRAHQAGPRALRLQRPQTSPRRRLHLALALLQSSARHGHGRILRRFPRLRLRLLRPHRPQPGGGHGQTRPVARVKDPRRLIHVLLHHPQRQTQRRQPPRLSRHLRRQPPLHHPRPLELVSDDLPFSQPLRNELQNSRTTSRPISSSPLERESVCLRFTFTDTPPLSLRLLLLLLLLLYISRAIARARSLSLSLSLSGCLSVC